MKSKNMGSPTNRKFRNPESGDPEASTFGEVRKP